MKGKSMILSKEKSDELLEALKPLLKWMNENCNPHTKVIVEQARVDLLDGVVGIPTMEFVKD